MTVKLKTVFRLACGRRQARFNQGVTNRYFQYSIEIERNRS